MTKDTHKNVVSAKRKALTFASKNFDPEVYADVAKSARLQQLTLCNSEYFAKPECFIEADATDKELAQGFFGKMSGSNFSKDNGIVIGEYVWGAEVKLGRKKALKMKCEYMLVYTGLEGAPDEYVRLYFSKLARFTSYPYFRAHFACHTSASGLNIPPLPSLSDRMD